jgi:hypothetical protein
MSIDIDSIADGAQIAAQSATTEGIKPIGEN